jgi:hypothetical protein
VFWKLGRIRLAKSAELTEAIFVVANPMANHAKHKTNAIRASYLCFAATSKTHS